MSRNSQNSRRWVAAVRAAAPVCLLSGLALTAIGRGQEGPSKNSSPATSAAPKRQPTAQEVLDIMRRQDETLRPVIPPNPPRELRQARPSGAPGGSNVAVRGRLLPEGYRLVDRPGRLVKSGQEWTFVFEERSKGPPEPSITLQRNQQLETMEGISEGGARNVVFVVSGTVQVYHGENYLLIDNVLIRPDLGNLK